MSGFLPILNTVTAEDIADAVILAAQSTAIEANIKYVNDIEVTGTGTNEDPWNPV